MSKVLKIKLAPEWVTGPLWIYRANDPIPENDSAEGLASEFNIPADLVIAIDAWSDEFIATYDPSDPAKGGGFPDEKTMTTWYKRGEQLAQQLATAMNISVEYPTYYGDHVFSPQTSYRPASN